MTANSSRPLRILQALADRISAARIGPDQSEFTRVYLGREHLFGDDLIYPAASIVEQPTTVQEERFNQSAVSLEVDVVGATQSDPEAPLLAGHALWVAMMCALFPSSATYVIGADRLGGLAKKLSYEGHEIFPRADGGATTEVVISLRVEYVLDVTNPTL